MQKTDGKIWNILPELSAEFKEEHQEFSDFELQLLFNRSILSKKEIADFFSYDYDALISDPFLFDNMEEGVKLIIKHVKEGNKITVYGDFDADGVTSSAALIEILRILKADIDVYLPHRVKEGYGLNKAVIDKIAKRGVKLIVTVDGGIRSKDEVEYAKSLGIEVLVTDHHTPPEDGTVPDCLLINPIVEGENYPFKYLAGVGVAFQLAKAIVSKAKLDDEQKDLLENLVLDLVAVGTVADCVSLVGENRALVKKGLEILNKTTRLGLLELMKVAKIQDADIKSWNIGFQISPRLNAAGRMAHANTAFELMITKDMEEAKSLALNLNERNIERQKNTKEIFDEVKKQIKDEASNIIIGVCGIDKEKEEDIWNEGVVGLVAGKICEKFYRPTLVITKTDDGYKGSGRSIAEFNLVEAVAECSEYLEKYGGHPMACGFSFHHDQLENFTNKLTEIANKQLKGLDLRPKLKIETVIDLGKVDEKLLEKISHFEPFGQSNEKPKLASLNVEVVDIVTMGQDGQHIKIRLRAEDTRMISAIGFNQTEKWKDLKVNDFVDIAFHADINNFNGRKDVQLRILDLKIRK